jgi:hypothetical protein
MNTQTYIARITHPRTLAGRLRTACTTPLLPLLLLLVLPAAVQAQFIYTINNGTVTITGYTGPGGAVTIPDTISGLPVTSIGFSAFSRCSTLASVTIPNSVTTIGDYAFIACTNLTSVTIPDSVTTIGNYAFQSCFSLSSVTIPNSVTSTADGAFEGCTSLTRVTIPNSVTDIGDYAFYYCQRLTSVSIPNSVTNIGTGAFSWCSSLATVTIGDGVTSIRDRAFSSCGLNGVIFQGNAPSLGSGVFGPYSQFVTVYYMPGTAGWGPAFGGCPTELWNLETQFSYTTTNGTITITGYTGPGPGIAVTIPDTINGLPVTSIGDYAFNYCSSLTSVTMPTGVTNIGDYAFNYCSSLTSVTIGINVTSIGWQAFYDCYSLNAVYFKGNAPGLAGNDAFLGTYNVTVYYLPGTTGWGPSFGGRPAVLWNPSIQTTNASFGVRTNRFGFSITGTANIPIVVEASVDLATASWTPLQTCTLTNGSIYFSDPQWTNYPARFYRLRSP